MDQYAAFVRGYRVSGGNPEAAHQFIAFEKTDHGGGIPDIYGQKHLYFPVTAPFST
jgi:hypothetical protein